VVYPWTVPPPVANQIYLFMHFLGASRDGLVARRVDLDTISSSDLSKLVSNHSSRVHVLKLVLVFVKFSIVMYLHFDRTRVKGTYYCIYSQLLQPHNNRS
jgi:hypothetical protein